MKTYQPISCSFYDVIEHNAVLGREVNISFQEYGGKSQEITTKILDTKTTPDGEFMLIEKEPRSIRMDLIISIGDKKLDEFGECKI